MRARIFLLPLMIALILALSTGPALTANMPVTHKASAARYRIDPGQSRFTVRAFAGGLFSAFAHDHTIAIRDFTGEAQFTYGTVEPASLNITIKANSLAVTDKVSQSDRQKIETTMREEVLETTKYPEITFRSTKVEATKTGEGQFQAKVWGDLTLHGVTRNILINTQLGFGENNLRARGDFSLLASRRRARKARSRRLRAVSSRQ